MLLRKPWNQLISHLALARVSHGIRFIRRLCCLLHGSVHVAWSHDLVHTGQGHMWIHVTRARTVLSSSLRDPPGSNSLRRGYVYRLRRSFIEECLWGPRHFWSRRAWLGYGSVPGPTLKRSCAKLTQLVGRKTNTVGHTGFISFSLATNLGKGKLWIQTLKIDLCFILLAAEGFCK